MAMQVILTQDVANLGKAGELVAVKPGFGRNFLIPNGMAVTASVQNKQRLEHDKAVKIDYKDPQTLKYFITDRGKIVPRRISGNCAKCQRKVALAIKRSRMVALMPFTVTGK